MITIISQFVLESTSLQQTVSGEKSKNKSMRKLDILFAFHENRNECTNILCVIDCVQLFSS